MRIQNIVLNKEIDSWTATIRSIINHNKDIVKVQYYTQYRSKFMFVALLVGIVLAKIKMRKVKNMP